MTRTAKLPALLFVLYCAVAVAAPQQPRPAPATGTAGMVSSAHPVATDAGLEILAAGGNAFDAAVAVAATLGVAEPMMSGVGGYGTILIYDAKKKQSWFLNCSSRIPRGVDSDAFRPPTPNYEANRVGAKSISTPGNVPCWEALSKRYGKLKWARLFDAAVRAAENGVTLDAWNAEFIGQAYPDFPDHTKGFYGRDGRALREGEQLVQRDLGRTLRAIAQRGARALHHGAVGSAMAQTLRERGSFLTLDDIRRSRGEWWQPIQISYRGHDIVTSSPPANSFDMLVRLGMMSRLDARKLGHNSADYLHWFAEVTKHGFWVRLRHASDPDVTAPPLAHLLSESYWTEQVAQIHPQRAKEFVPPQPASAAAPQRHTTHFVVADRWGNVVSATQTLGNAFGSRIMPPGTGIWLNNSLAYSTFEPKGNPMDAFPGRHKLSGDCPAFIFRDGRLWAALGTPGGHTIGQTVPQMVMNLIDFEMDIQQAIAAPRISFGQPDDLYVEPDFPAALRAQLEARGHRVRAGRRLGNAHGLTIEYDPSGKPVRFTGTADPRGGGAARGLR